MGLRAPEQEVTKPTVEVKPVSKIKSYTVHVQPKFPAWDEVDGFDVEVFAKNGTEAINASRRKMASECRFSRNDGAVSYKVKKD